MGGGEEKGLNVTYHLKFALLARGPCDDMGLPWLALTLSAVIILRLSMTMTVMMTIMVMTVMMIIMIMTVMSGDIDNGGNEEDGDNKDDDGDEEDDNNYDEDGHVVNDDGGDYDTYDDDGEEEDDDSQFATVSVMRYKPSLQKSS
eukprot:s970_g2.t1